MSETGVGGTRLPPVQGAAVGILMLDTGFERPPGDVGNALTWPFPVLWRVVRGVSAADAVTGPPATLLQPMTTAAQALVADGAAGIVANCGFLAPLQRAIAWAAGVPVLTSALQQIPMVEATLPPGHRAGVITISAEALGPERLTAAGARADTPVAGVPAGGALAGPILGTGGTLERAAVEAEMADAALRLVAGHPEVGAIVLECTNMAPYARAVERAAGLPVWSMVSLVTWFHAGLRPPVWPEG